MKKPLTMIICDYHQKFSQQLSYCLEETGLVYTVGNTRSYIEAMSLLTFTEASFLLIDLKVVLKNKLESLKELKKLHPKMKIIGLTLFDDEYKKEDLAGFGVDDIITRVTELPQIIDELKLLFKQKIVKPARKMVAVY